LLRRIDAAQTEVGSGKKMIQTIPSLPLPSLAWAEDLMVQFFLIGGLLGEPQRSQSSGIGRASISIFFNFFAQRSIAAFL
jgi:hypothetical protein